ncbi:MAG: HAMP domain-containing protein, partial [Treponema sp.]|nr:HAMP domain-containing protein [Treponema sp.]
MHRNKPSCITLFTLISLSISVLITASLSAVFFLNLRKSSYTQLEANIQENMAHIQDTVLSLFKDHEQLVNFTAMGLMVYLNQEGIEPDVIQAYFKKVSDTIPDIALLYYTNNMVWNRAGGYSVFYPEWTPQADWNNTQRDWFINAKQARGAVAYTNPYVDAVTGKIAITLSAMVQDETGQDRGVIAQDVLVTSLETIINQGAPIAHKQMFLITKTGLFITHPDEQYIMQQDYFATLGLESYRNQILSQDSFSTLDERVFIHSATIPGANWILVSTIPTTVVFADVQRLLIQTFIFCLVLFILAAGILVVFTRKVLSPLRDMESFSGVIAAGDFSGTVPDYGTGEISRLAEGFNTINEQISGLVKNITAS